MYNEIKKLLEDFGKAVKDKINQGHENRNRLSGIMELVVSAITLSTYCMISPALAEYEGKKALYWTAASAVVLLLIVAAWEIVCLIGYDALEKFFRGIYGLIKKGVYFIRKGIHAPRFRYIIPLAAVMAICVGITVWQFHSTECYSSVTEIYGIPVGVGKPLARRELKNCAEYWEIKDYSLRRTMVVTHEDAFHENEIMGEYSSIYNMAFFQPVDHMVYRYKKNRKKFGSLDKDAYLAADENKFREPTKISYYNGNGKLILQLKKKTDSDTFAIVTYSLDSAPQLFNSTLLRLPEADEDSKEKQEKDENISRNAIGTSIMSQGIEVTYNSEGLPDTRRISPHIYNLYGVNGERYVYDQNKRLTALYYLDSNGAPICNQKGIMMVSFEYDEKNRLTGIRYFSDEKGEEKIEGFQGVFCEKFEYDTDGNLCVRKQLNQSENRWYDKNGVCEYRYTYDKGRLKREEFLDFSGNMAGNQNVNLKSTLVEFKETKDEKGNKVITVSLDPIIRLAEQGDSALVQKEEKEEQEEKKDIIAVMSESVIGSKESNDDSDSEQDNTGNNKISELIAPVMKVWDTENGEKNSGSMNEKGEDGLGAAKEAAATAQNISKTDGREEEIPLRNYTKVCYVINKKDKMVRVSYYHDSKLVKNEQGFCVEEINYDDKLRVEGKTYLDEEEKLCLTAGGYSQVFFAYSSASGDEKERIEYRAGGELAINRKENYGYAAVEYKPYEEAENQNGDTTITLKYYDQDNDPFMLPEKGYAKIRQTYNNRGLLIRETYHNEEEGQEIPAYRTDYMAAGVDYEYADDGNQVCAVYKDASDQPVNRYDTGYAVRFREFENGKLVRIHYQGYINHTLQNVTNKEHGAGSVKYIYANGHTVETQYFDINGNPALRSDAGYAVRKEEYNNQGLVAAYSYYGTDGELIARKDTGYAIIRYQYDELGREILLHYYGADQQPVFRKEYLCAGMQYQYDKKGNRNDIRYLDKNGNLMVRRDLGYAGISRKYNADGKIEEECYFDSDGQPVECKEGGYAVYKGVYEGQNLVRVEYRDKYGKLVPHTETGYAIVAYKYNDEGKCIWENYFDKNVQPVISKKYHCAGFWYEYDEEKNRRTIGYLGLLGEAIIRSDLGYAQVCKQYDSFGRLIGETYYDTDSEKTLCKEGGYASYEDQYDEKGNCIRNIYRDTQDRLTLRKDSGCAVIENEYDDFGRCIRISYYGTDYDFKEDEKQEDEEHEDDNRAQIDINKKALVFNAEYECAGFLYYYDQVGNRTDISYIDTDRNIMVRRDLGFARIHREYDEQGDLVAESYYDVNNNPTARKEEGYASFKKAYQNGQCIEAVYYDTDEKPVLRKDQGIAMERWQYDELGQCVLDSFYDVEGKPVINKKYMCATFVYEYDSRGNRTDIWYRDRDGEIMIRPDLGYAHRKNEYDNRGNLIKGSYYDSEERLTLSKETGAAYFEDQYDDYGNCLGGRCYGKNRELTARKDKGYAVNRNFYDKYGQYVAVFYYGADGKTPVLSTEHHCAGFKYEYDGKGDRTTETYVGTDGRSMVREDLGYVQEVVANAYDSETNRKIIRRKFIDRNGDSAAKVEGGYTNYEDIFVCDKWVESRYYKEGSWKDEKLLVRDDVGYAIIRREYDDFWQCISVSYYNEKGDPVRYLGEADSEGNRPEICAAFVYEHDEKGNTVAIQYRDTDGNIMSRADLGYAQVCKEYDEQGNITEERYYDTEHKQTADIAGGYFSVDWCYSNGNCTEVRYYDEKKRLMSHSDQKYAIQKNQFDEYGQCVWLSYYDTDDAPVVNTRYGGASFEYRYDLLGNRTDAIYRDTEGNMTAREGLGYAWVSYKYDEWSRLAAETYYDAEQNPTIDINGYAGIRYEYDEQGVSHKKPFDLNGAEIN